VKLSLLITFLFLLNGCAEPSKTQEVAPAETETYLSVEPTKNTKVVTYHVQTEKFSTALQMNFKEALASLSDKCWIWALPSYKNNLTTNGPDYCVRFTSYTSIKPLKPYKKEPTNQKMQLTALTEDGHIQVQNFIWDGKKLQRVRNSDSSLRERSFQEFLVLWALK